MNGSHVEWTYREHVEDDFMGFVNMVRSTRQIRGLMLQSIQPKHATSLGDLVAFHPTLESVFLGNISDASAIAFLESIRRNGPDQVGLRSLVFHGLGLTNQGVQYLADSLLHRPGMIQELRLRNNRANLHGLAYLTGKLANYPSINIFEVSSVCLAGPGDEFYRFSAFLSQRRIRVLVLEGCEITDRDLQTILSNLNGSECLQALHLNGNGITDIGCSAFRNCCLPSLYQLDLGNNFMIGNRGVVEVTQAAVECSLASLRYVRFPSYWINELSISDVLNLTKRANIVQLQFLGRLRVNRAVQYELERTNRILRSQKFRVTLALCSVRSCHRIGKQSYCKILPLEIVQKIVHSLSEAEVEPISFSSN